jgi:transcriptional regulator GlxA family with amidase domain
MIVTIGGIDKFDIILAMQISVLALDGVFDTGLAIMLDAFGTANELAELFGVTTLRFEARAVAVRENVHTFKGLNVPVIPAADGAASDLVVVPALGYKTPERLLAALARPDVTDAGKVLRRWADQGMAIAAACIGTFVLAEATLLDGHDATTTWWLAPLFRQRYPKVRLDESRILVPSAQFVTAGAALSHLDLALWIIRQASPDLAALAAKYLVVDSRPSQAVYMIPSHLAHADQTVERFERWARERLAKGFSLDEAARATRTSARTLARRMHKVLGKSPLSYFQDLRVESAVHLLKTSDETVDQIASRVGYSDAVTLRVLLRRRLGLGVRELRPSQRPVAAADSVNTLKRPLFSGLKADAGGSDPRLVHRWPAPNLSRRPRPGGVRIHDQRVDDVTLKSSKKLPAQRRRPSISY